jgi:hypothetical protein
MRKEIEQSDFLKFLDSLFKKYKITQVYTKHKFDNQTTNRDIITYYCNQNAIEVYQALPKAVHDFEPEWHGTGHSSFCPVPAKLEDFPLIYDRGKFYDNTDDWTVMERPPLCDRDGSVTLWRPVDKAALGMLRSHLAELEDTYHLDNNEMICKAVAEQASILVSTAVYMDQYAKMSGVENTTFAERTYEYMKQATDPNSNPYYRITDLASGIDMLWLEAGGTYAELEQIKGRLRGSVIIR